MQLNTVIGKTGFLCFYKQENRLKRRNKRDSHTANLNLFVNTEKLFWRLSFKYVNPSFSIFATCHTKSVCNNPWIMDSCSYICSILSSSCIAVDLTSVLFHLFLKFPLRNSSYWCHSWYVPLSLSTYQTNSKSIS